jgi:hypothetical protein
MSLTGSTHHHDDDCMAKLRQLTPDSEHVAEDGAFRVKGSIRCCHAQFLNLRGVESTSAKRLLAGEKLQAFDALGDAILRIKLWLWLWLYACKRRQHFKHLRLVLCARKTCVS